MAVGFGTEPDAYVGVPNSRVADARRTTASRSPTSATALNVTVGFGDQTSDPMTFEPAFEVGEFGRPASTERTSSRRSPGTTRSRSPARSTATTIDVSLTSGPKTFMTVKDLAGSTFPAGGGSDERRARVAHPGGVGSHDDGRHRRDDRGTEAEAAASSAQDAADSAKTIGIIGVVVGAIGLIFGIVAFMATRKRA